MQRLVFYKCLDLIYIDLCVLLQIIMGQIHTVNIRVNFEDF